MGRIQRISTALITLTLLTSVHSQCPFINNCLQCDDLVNCDRCEDGYVLGDIACMQGKQKISLSDQNRINSGANLRVQSEGVEDRGFTFGLSACLLQWKGLCLICGNGYEMGIGGNCLPRFQQCLAFQDLMCVQCSNKLALREGQCINLGCQTSNYYHCSSCKPGYKLNEYQHCQVPGCLAYQSGKCVECPPDTIPTNGTCLPMSVSCKRYSKQGQCLQCKYQEFSLINGACIDKNCINAEQNYGMCVTCGVGYILSDTRVCVAVFKDEHCVRVNINSCIRCQDGYSVGKEGRCRPLPPNCMEATCKYCKKGFISYNGKCETLNNCGKVSGNICLACQSGYSLTQIGTCTKTITNCMEYSFSGCLKCPPNYNLSNSTCQLNPSYSDPNCNARNYKNECILCKQRYRLVAKYNSLCLMANTQCKAANSEGECLSCYEGYKLNDVMGDCVPVMPIQNCAQQVGGQCQRCANRHYLVSSVTCKEVDALCKDYEKELGYCTSCYEGYYLVGNMCEPVDALFQPPSK